MLWPPIDLRLDSCGRKVRFYGGDSSFKRLHAFALLRLDLLFQVLVFLRPKVLEAKILQLAFDCGHAEAVCERRVNIKRFTRFSDLFLLGTIFECAEVVQAVRQLDDNHAHILCDRKEKLAQVLSLRLLLGQNIALSGFCELCNAIHHDGDVFPEVCAHGIKRHCGTILHHIVQKAGDHRMAVHAHVKKHPRHRFRMCVIRLARFALLILVRLLCKGNRAVQKLHFLLRKALCAGFPQVSHSLTSPRFFSDLILIPSGSVNTE